MRTALDPGHAFKVPDVGLSQGQLTSIGFMQHVRIGKILNYAYSDFLAQHIATPRDIYIRSTNYVRTIRVCCTCYLRSCLCFNFHAYIHTVCGGVSVHDASEAGLLEFRGEGILVPLISNQSQRLFTCECTGPHPLFPRRASRGHARGRNALFFSYCERS